VEGFAFDVVPPGFGKASSFDPAPAKAKAAPGKAGTGFLFHACA
jgi:hypothetical protein